MLLMELKEPKKAQKKGTYVGIRYSKESLELIASLLDSVPNPIDLSDVHTTLIYSRKYFDFKPKGKLEEPIKIKFKKYSIFTAKTGEACLVVELDSPELVARHNEIMKKYEATYDFDEYKPHITLSYNVGDGFDLSIMSDAKELPAVYATKEYSEELNLNWNSTKKS